MTQAEIHPSLEELEELGPEALFEWAYTEYGERAGILSSFQNTGCVMIDLAQRVAPGLRVITVDTERLHPETYAVMAAIEGRYGLRIEHFRPEPERLRKMIEQHGEYLFFDTKAKQEFCCNVRKVEPNQRALASLDVWFTGLRRDQSEFRAKTPKVSLVKQPGGHSVIKIAPLNDWTEAQVEDYMKKHSLPRNALYDQGYTSIGCMICTTPTRPGEDKRAGRWRWFNQYEKGDKKECGIHVGGSGI
jgi:phosphoadenosine phosphosulfate reductase